MELEAVATYLLCVILGVCFSVFITGYKGTLTSEDLSHLMPEERASVVVPKFLYQWRKQLEKAGYGIYDILR